MRFIFAVPVHGDLPPHAPSTVTAQMRPREGGAFRFHAFTLSRRVGRRAPGFRLEEVASIFRGYGLKGHELDHVTNAIAADPKRWVDPRMQFELGPDPRDPKRAPISALTIAIGSGPWSRLADGSRTPLGVAISAKGHQRAGRMAARPRRRKSSRCGLNA
jgi:hypothetical protein